MRLPDLEGLRDSRAQGCKDIGILGFRKFRERHEAQQPPPNIPKSRSMSQAGAWWPSRHIFIIISRIIITTVPFLGVRV